MVDFESADEAEALSAELPHFRGADSGGLAPLSKVWRALRSNGRPEALITAVLVLGYVGWVLSLPMFPTQDGPMHLYLVHILHNLLFDRGSMWEQFYLVKHYLPPYALHYYLLMALEQFFPVLVAEKLMVCFFFVTFTYGFRYLARAVGKGADSMTLLALGLCLNYSLGMGFMNYCLSLAFSLWAAGVWLHLLRRPNVPRALAVVFLAVVVTLTHPVGLLLLLLFLAISLSAHILAHRRGPAWLAAGLRRNRLSLATLFFAATPLLYVRRFALMAVPATSVAHHASSLFPSWLRPRRVATPLFYPMHGLDGHVYGFCWLLTILIASRALFTRSALNGARQGALPNGWIAAALAAAAVLPFMPFAVSDGLFFGERLTVVVWLVVMLAGSTGPQPARGLRVAIAAVALATWATAFHLGERLLRPIAVELAAIPHLDPTRTGKVGLLLEESSLGVRTFRGLPFDPYLWAPAHLFRVNNLILYNTPWMEEATIPIGTTPAFTVPTMPGHANWHPAGLDYWMRNHPRQALPLLGRSDFYIVDQVEPWARNMNMPQQLRSLQEQGLPAPDCSERLDSRLLFCNMVPMHNSIVSSLRTP